METPTTEQLIQDEINHINEERINIARRNVRSYIEQISRNVDTISALEEQNKGYRKALSEIKIEQVDAASILAGM